MQRMEQSIKTYSLAQLEQLMLDMGQPKFRAMQIAQWLYGRHASSYDEMTDLSKSLREQLAVSHPFSTLTMIDRQISRDKTRKYVFECEDGQRVETVAMPSVPSQKDGKNRLTVCFSTQVGCAMGCAFCATGHEGFTRNLSIGEIMDQIILAQADMGQRVSNVVAMGQGEPFLNYENVIDALHIINHPKLLKIGARRVTVSTCGIIPGIERFAQEPEQFTLAISLHATQQEVRDALMPKVAKQTLPQLKKALQHYIQATDRRVTLEYLLIKDQNDDQEDLEALIDFCHGLLVHVNLLPLNAIPSSQFQPSPLKTLNTWKNELERKKIETTVRNSRGSDIAGACGQLKNAISKAM